MVNTENRNKTIKFNGSLRKLADFFFFFFFFDVVYSLDSKQKNDFLFIKKYFRCGGLDFRCGLLLLIVIPVIYTNIEIDKNDDNVKLASDHLYLKFLFTWLSLVMSLMVSFLCCPFSH